MPRNFKIDFCHDSVARMMLDSRGTLQPCYTSSFTDKNSWEPHTSMPQYASRKSHTYCKRGSTDKTLVTLRPESRTLTYCKRGSTDKTRNEDAELSSTPRNTRPKLVLLSVPMFVARTTWRDSFALTKKRRNKPWKPNELERMTMVPTCCSLCCLVATWS
jgi:hypothetical protein